MKDKAKILVIVVLAILAVLTFYPFVIMLFISFKDILSISLINVHFIPPSL